jgi:pyruvate kinase
MVSWACKTSAPYAFFSQNMMQVYAEVESWVRRENAGAMTYPQLSKDPKILIAEEICNSAALIAESLKARAIFVYTRIGLSAQFMSRRRPQCPIFAVTGVDTRHE